MFRIPYRWLPSTFFPNIRSMWLDIHHGVKNIFRWIPVIWFDADFDWDFLAHIMEYKLRRMSKVFQNGHHLHCNRDARQCIVAAEILKRMQDSSVYYDNASKRYPDRGKRWAEMIHKTEEHDVTILLRQLRHIKSWWD